METKIVELTSQKADLKGQFDKIAEENDVLRKKFAKILDDFQGYIESQDREKIEDDKKRRETDIK